MIQAETHFERKNDPPFSHLAPVLIQSGCLARFKADASVQWLCFLNKLYRSRFYSFLLSSPPNTLFHSSSLTPIHHQTKTTMLFATVFTSLLAAGLALAQDYTVTTPVRVLLFDTNIADLVFSIFTCSILSHMLFIYSRTLYTSTLIRLTGCFDPVS